MDKKFKHKLNMYLRQTRKLLVGSFNMKCAYIINIKQHIFDIIDENPNITFDELVNIIGTPEEIANNFGKTNIDEVIAKSNDLFRYRTILITALFVSILLIIILMNLYGGRISVFMNLFLGRVL